MKGLFVADQVMFPHNSQITSSLIQDRNPPDVTGGENFRQIPEGGFLPDRNDILDHNVPDRFAQ